MGTPPTDWQQGRGLGDPCRVYRVVCQALPLPDRARPVLACDLHYYERRSNMRPAARGAPSVPDPRGVPSGLAQPAGDTERMAYGKRQCSL